MKAVQVVDYGGSETLEINEIPEPVPSAGQVLVKIHAASFNPFDRTLLSGTLQEKIPVKFPFTLGGDFSGVIEAVSEDVNDLKVKDLVYGTAIILNGGSGSFAEVAVANRENIAKMPSVLSFEEAAALPLVGCSAVQALYDHINLQPNTKILIHGGAGGIGHIAVQIAANVIKANVSATVSTRDIEFVKSLGAKGVIDYTMQNFEKLITEYDAVFDTVGGEVTNKSLKCLKKGGVMVTMIGDPNEEKANELGVTAIRQSTKNNAEHLKKLAEIVETGHVKPAIGKTFAMEDIKSAYEFFDSGSYRGKIVLKIK